MKKICNLRQSQLSFKDMRYFAIIGILCAFAQAAFAQAADPKAIDLSGKMDTIARGSKDLFTGLAGFLNVGLQNPDKWEDFEINYVGLSQSGRMRLGGPLIMDTTNNPWFVDIPHFCGDINKDGRNDLIIDFFHHWFKGKSEYPYYDSISNTSLTIHGSTSEIGLEGIIDYDEDGFPDILGIGHDDANLFIILYRGSTDFGKNQFTFPSDSLTFRPPNYKFMVFGKFGRDLKPMIILSKGKEISLIKHTTDLAHDSIILMSDTMSTGITPTNFYVTDITGDGIDDLIISDGLHIYIFKGGDDFGTYPLTPKNAFYIISSPLIRDFGDWSFLTNDFGNYMHACGNLTGTGIPYLAVGTSTDPQAITRGFTFFYAGGKALDTLYDAVIGYYNIGGELIDTLHSVNSTGRTVCLVTDPSDKYYNLRDLDFLMSRDCENIPHTTNPNMVSVRSAIPQKFSATCFPAIANKFTKVQIVADKYSEASITVFDLLGQALQIRKVHLDPGENTEFFNTTGWMSGTYIMKVETSSGVALTKVIVNH